MSNAVTNAALSELAVAEGVPSAFAAARDGIDAVLRDRGLRRTTPQSTAESLLRGAHASGVLAGSGSTLAQVRDGDGDDIAAGAVRLSASLLSLAPILTRSPLQALARLHTLVGAGTTPDDALGRPVDPGGAARLQALARLLGSAPSGPALVLAAVAHAEIATATPFGGHDAVVARAVERLVLVARGVDEKSLTVPEAAHLARRDAYESGLRSWASGTTSGRQVWLLYAAQAFAAGAECSPVRD